MSEQTCFIVKMTKITYPDGKKLTRSVVPFDVNDVTYFPRDDAINKSLPKIDVAYDSLVDFVKREGLGSLSDALDRFFGSVSKSAIVGGLLDVLPEDLDADDRVVEKALTETCWFQQHLDFIRSEFKKRSKSNPIRYAESVRQLVDIFGLNYTLELLENEEIEMKRSTAVGLCRVAGESPNIKKLIREGLPITIVFELPRVDENQREKIAKGLASKKGYAEQKKYLKRVKMNLP